jgi:hypothetical protein
MTLPSSPASPSLRPLRALTVALGLALLPWRAGLAASLVPEPPPAPRSSRFT